MILNILAAAIRDWFKHPLSAKDFAVSTRSNYNHTGFYHLVQCNRCGKCVSADTPDEVRSIIAKHLCRTETQIPTEDVPADKWLQRNP